MSRRSLRCAIYTRKSTEEGLDQDFNSLDAQREAGEAYIKSQTGEGWHLLRTRYDDGGVSGGTMDRPALQQLLANIRARRVDTVVVYKVDRLTRSLADFAKIVEVFDAHGVSFVSVTQQFNTTTSMGRLTLNMLLSFAQFEREVTGERIRDKIAASKKKGMWMGGVVPLGYKVVDRKLVISEAEAKTVRTLFRLYLEHGTVAPVQREAHHLGLRTKARRPNTGARPGGEPFTRGHIYKLLCNPIYVGEIAHKGECYPGEHRAIVDRETWNRVQAQLNRNAVNRHHRSNAKKPSLFAGLLFDGQGRPMKPSHSRKAGRCYRYYISRLPEDASIGAEATWRLPATALEEAALIGICSFLKDALHLSQALRLTELPSDRVKATLSKASRLAERLQGARPSEQRRLLLEMVSRIDVQLDRLRITLLPKPLRSRLGHATDQDTERGERIIALDVPVRFRRRGVETKLVMTGEVSPTSNQDRKLITAVVQGHCWFEELRAGAASSVGDLVTRHGVDQGDVTRTLRLAFLAPDVVEAILAGHQPIELTVARLKRMRLPLSWDEQRRLLGFTT